MKTNSVLLTFLILSSAFPGSAPAEGPSAVPSIALLSKVILDVTRKDDAADWRKAARGDILNSGNKVKTGEKSLAVVKFKDNSMIRVRELSELTIGATQQGGAFSKSVQIETGVVGFSISKQQRNEEFRFTSPTSVASVRGTQGVIVSSPSADTLTVTEGLVAFTNVISSQSSDVAAGYTGISTPDGRLVTRPSTPAERNAAEDVLRSGGQEKKLDLELRDNRGTTKHLRIDFKD